MKEFFTDVVASVLIFSCLVAIGYFVLNVVWYCFAWCAL